MLYCDVLRGSFSQYRLSLGPGKMVELSELKCGQEIASKLGVGLSEAVYSVKWIKHHGTEYRPDFIICTEVTCEMPVFCKIKTIAVKDNNVLLCGTLMETVCFVKECFLSLNVHCFNKCFKCDMCFLCFENLFLELI